MEKKKSSKKQKIVLQNRKQKGLQNIAKTKFQINSQFDDQQKNQNISNDKNNQLDNNTDKDQNQQNNFQDQTFNLNSEQRINQIEQIQSEQDLQQEQYQYQKQQSKVINEIESMTSIYLFKPQQKQNEIKSKKSTSQFNLNSNDGDSNITNKNNQQENIQQEYTSQLTETNEGLVQNQFKKIDQKLYESFDIDKRNKFKLEDKQNQNVQNLTQIKTVKTKKLNIIIYITISVLFLIGFSIGLYFLIKNLQKNKVDSRCIKPNRTNFPKCTCLEDYYEFNNRCIGPASDIPKQDFEMSIKGQEKNVPGAFRVHVQRSIEYFEYQIEQVQVFTMNGEQTRNTTDITYTYGILTTGIKEDRFNVMLLINNCTILSGTDKTFIDLYPNSFVNKLNDGENQEVDEDTEEEQEDDETQSQQELLNSYHKNQAELLGIDEEEYAKSQATIVQFNIYKNGTVSDLIYPINLRKEFKNMIPTIISQYSPQLDTSVYHQIEENTSGNRRLLQQQDQNNQSPESQFFGDVEQNYSAEVDENTDMTALNKGYSSQTDSKDGKQLPQNSQMQSKTEMQNGQVVGGSTQSAMSLSSSNVQEEDNDNLKVQESKNLIEDIAVEEKTNLKLLLKQKLTQLEIDTIKEHLNINYLKNQTMAEFNQDIIDEIDFNNKQADLQSDGENLEELDGEDELIRFRNLKQGDLLVSPITFQLFTFNLLGIPVKGMVEFYCKEGPAGKNTKDICYFKPAVEFMGITIGSAKAKIKAKIKKMVLQFNAFRNQIIGRIQKVSNVLEDSLININENTEQIVDEAIKFLTPDTNPIVSPILDTREAFNQMIYLVFQQFNQKIDDILFNSSDFIDIPFQNLQNQVVKYVTKLMVQSEDIWNFIETDLSDDLSKFKQLLDTKKYVPQQVCEDLNQKIVQFSEYSDEQRSIARNYGNELFLKKVQEPIVKLLQNIIYIDENDFSEDNEFDIKNLLISELKNLANTLISSIIEAPLQSKFQDEIEQLNQFGLILNEQIIQIKDQFVIQWNSLILECTDKISHDGEHFDGEENKIIEYFNNQISLGQYQIDFDEFSDIADQISEQILQIYPNLFKEGLNTIKNLKFLLLNFHKDFKDDFMNSINNIIENISNLGTNIKGGLEETVDNIQSGVVNLIDEVKNLVPELKNALQNKNEEGDEYDDEVLDIESLDDQIQDILSIKDEFPKVKQTIDKTKNLHQNFQVFKKFIEDFTQKPFENFKQQKIEFQKQKSVDTTDFQILFKPLTDIAFEQVAEEMVVSIKDRVEDQIMSTLDNFVDNLKDELEDRLQELLFDQLTDMNSLFKDGLKFILDKFQTSELTLFKKRFFKMKYVIAMNYPTPIGIIIFIDFGVYCEAGLNVNFFIKGKSVNLKGDVYVKAEATARGGISIYIAMIGIYVTALLFMGTLSIIITLGISSKIYGQLLVKLELESLTITAGLFVQYLWFRCIRVCINMGCFKICFPIIEFYYSDPIDLVEPFVQEGLSWSKDLLKLRI